MLHVTADQTVFDAVGDVGDHGALEHDAVLDLGLANRHALADGGERADVGARDLRTGADDDRAADHRPLDRRARFDHDLALDARLAVDGALDAAFERVEDEPVGLEHVLELARVLPPALDQVRADLERAIDEVLNGVGDLELIAEARPDALHGGEDLRAEHVDADECQVALRFLRLLDESDDAAVLEFGHAEHLRIGHSCEQDLRGGFFALERLDEVGDAAIEQVVPEVHHERVAADERLADEHRVREAPRRVLLDVGDARAPPRSVADGRANLRLRVTDDDADVADARGDERLEPVKEHGLVGDRDELLGAGVGDGTEAGALAAAEDQALHRIELLSPKDPNGFENDPRPAREIDTPNRRSGLKPEPPPSV